MTTSPATLRALRPRRTKAVRGHADLEKTVHISYGDVPAGRYLTDISLNRAMALYDAAALTGLEPHLSDDAIQALHAIASEAGDMLRKMGIFPPEVAVAADATPEDRFLAYIGRQPRDTDPCSSADPSRRPVSVFAGCSVPVRNVIGRLRCD